MNKPLARTYVLTVLLSAVSFTQSAIAGWHTDTRFDRIRSCHQKRFYVSLTGMYAKSMNKDLWYGVVNVSPSLSRRQSVPQEYQFSGGLDVGYYLNSKNDLKLSWMHYDTNDAETLRGTSTSARLLGTSGPEGMRGETNFKVNEINIELGHCVDLPRAQTRLHYGLSYVTIGHELKCLRIPDALFRMESEYWGIGPRFGFDFNYPLYCSSHVLGAVGHFSGSLLCGKFDYLSDGKPFVRRIPIKNLYTIIPSGTMKLGLAYHYQCHSNWGQWRMEAGWQLSGYFHSIVHTSRGGPQEFSHMGISGAYLTACYSN